MHGIPTIGVAWHFCSSKNLILTLAHMCNTCWLRDQSPMACTCKSAKFIRLRRNDVYLFPCTALIVCVVDEGD